MQDNRLIQAAYHRALGRYRERTGISYPFVREDCVQDDGTITDTNAFEPMTMAKWSVDAIGRVRVSLV